MSDKFSYRTKSNDFAKGLKNESSDNAGFLLRLESKSRPISETVTFCSNAPASPRWTQADYEKYLQRLERNQIIRPVKPCIISGDFPHNTHLTPCALSTNVPISIFGRSDLTRDSLSECSPSKQPSPPRTMAHILDGL